MNEFTCISLDAVPYPLYFDLTVEPLRRLNPYTLTDQTRSLLLEEEIDVNDLHVQLSERLKLPTSRFTDGKAALSKILDWTDEILTGMYPKSAIFMERNLGGYKITGGQHSGNGLVYLIDEGANEPHDLLTITLKDPPVLAHVVLRFVVVPAPHA